MTSIVLTANGDASISAESSRRTAFASKSASYASICRAATRAIERSVSTGPGPRCRASRSNTQSAPKGVPALATIGTLAHARTRFGPNVAKARSTTASEARSLEENGWRSVVAGAQDVRSWAASTTAGS